LEEIQK
jgi:hypothetical protein